MKQCFRIFLLLSIGFLQACGASQKLSEGKVKEKIRELGLIDFKEKQIQVEKIVQSGENQVVAQVTVPLAFRLSKSKREDWHVDAIRFGDRDWVEMKAFVAALDVVRLQQTKESLQRLQDGIRRYQEKVGTLTPLSTIVQLTDRLFPTYLTEIIRHDAWNHELTIKQIGPGAYRVTSAGPDGILGNADDIGLEPSM